MLHYPYSIVGAGMAGHAAIQGIRELDPDNPIGVIGVEAHKPYKRPPLSKGLVAHENNARAMGKAAGQAMARHLAGAEAEPYEHLPFFYSDLFDLGYEAVGLVDSRLRTVSYWQKPNEKGVFYYLADGRVRGALMWNVWKQLDAARKLIAEPGPLEPADLAARVPWAAPPKAPAELNQPGGTNGD